MNSPNGSLPEMWFERGIQPRQVPMIEGLATPTGPDLGELVSAQAAIAGVGYQWNDDFFATNAPNLTVLVRSGIGYDVVDLDAATRHKVMACNTPEGPTVSTAEHTVALLLSAAKLMPVAQQRLREATSNYVVVNDGIELDGLTVGIVGFGRIGSRVGRTLAALGMNILVNDPFIEDEQIPPSMERVSFEDALTRADVVTLHLPLEPATQRFMGAAEFDAMRPGAIFVNAARGGLVDHDALVAAIDSGRLHSAALDVTDPEPLPTDHPLLHRENVIVTPHIAAATVAGKNRMYNMAVEAALAALRGDEPANLLNPAVRGS